MYTGRITPTLTTGEHTQRTLFCTVLPTFLYIFISKLKKEEKKKLERAYGQLLKGELQNGTEKLGGS